MIVKDNNQGEMVKCEKCGKILIKRLPNGLFHFIFGKNLKDSLSKGAPVELLIYGSIRMKCLNRLCQHDNLLTFLPPNDNLTIPAKEGNTRTTTGKGTFINKYKIKE